MVRYCRCWPYFFEEAGLNVTVTSDCYIHMFENFQQDWGTAHTGQRSLKVLREIILNRLISFRDLVG